MISWQRRVARGIGVALLLAGLGVIGHGLWVHGHAIRGDLDAVRSKRPGVRVLFVGNSFTSANHMVTLLEKLAQGEPGGVAVFPVSFAPGGSRLHRAVHAGRLLGLLHDERWDYVVLQEHSEIPAVPQWREQLMFPSAGLLDAMARGRGAQTMLFMTWGYRDGDRRIYPRDTYSAMQARVAQGYLQAGALLRAPVAPVGVAWQRAVREDPTEELWSDDGRHPSLAGSYLAACVFYAVLTHRNPAESTFTAGLGPARAHRLAEIAAVSPIAYPGYRTDSR